MISGHYPFLGDTLQETYDKVERRFLPFLVFNMNVNTRNSLSHCYQIDCQWSCANTWWHESPTCWFDPKASLQRFIFFFKTHMILICWSFGTRCALLTDALFLFCCMVTLQIPGIVSPCRLWRSILGLLGTWAQFLNTSAGVALAAERGMIFGNNYNNKASPDGLV